ncbi:hypothetical protein AAG906_032963 [Vitis piasezkii]
MANAHKRRNNVDKIKINGVWLSEENEIKEGVFGALLGCSGDKAPGSDGFSMTF